MKELKYSRQREAVLEALKGRCDHPTADTLYQSLREEFPKISLGTVYRNLSLLTDMGEINKISCGDGIERYDYDKSEHYHFICHGCGKVVDISATDLPDLDKLAVSDDIGIIDGHSLVFHGYCKECYKEKLKLNA